MPAWRIAQWLLVLACRINQGRNGGPVLHLCCCCSTQHIVANLADPALAAQPTILIPSLRATHLHAFAGRLGRRCLPPCSAAVPGILVLWVLCGGRIKAWVPHLCPLEFPARLLRVLREMERFAALSYFDDGLGAVSRQVAIYREGWLPRDAPIHSWDHWSRPAAAGFPATLHRSSFGRALRLVESRDPSLCRQGLPPLQRHGLAPPRQGFWPERVTVVLASRHLDAERCLRLSGATNGRLPAFYVPHYRPEKNDPELMKTLSPLPMEMPEFGLLGLVQSVPCQIFFGVSSTVVFLMELLFRVPKRLPVQLVFCPVDAGALGCADELQAFRRLMNHYQSLAIFSAKGLSMAL